MNIADDDAILAEWRDAFVAKNSDLRCPHHSEHEDFYKITDLHSDGQGSFSYHVETCCDAYRALLMPMLAEERLYNPPELARH